MPTLVLSPRYTEDSSRVRDAALEAGWHVERVQGWRIPEHLRGEPELAIYGEPLFAAVAADQLERALLEPPFSWLATLPERYLRRRVRFTTLLRARALAEPAFVKPADDKCFPARVYASGAELGSSAIPAHTPVLVADPVDVELELRCFVLDRVVETLSVYSRDGNLARAEDGSWPATADELAAARAFATSVLADQAVELPAAVVLDVGVLRGTGWAVIEANAAWGSGIYGCDPVAVLRVVRRACVPRLAPAPEDLRWIVERSGEPAPQRSAT